MPQYDKNGYITFQEGEEVSDRDAQIYELQTKLKRPVTQGDLADAVPEEQRTYVSAPPTRGPLDRFVDRASDMFSTAGEGVNAAIMRRDQEMREEDLIRADAQRRGLRPEQADAIVEQNRLRRAAITQETRGQRALRDEGDPNFGGKTGDPRERLLKGILNTVGGFSGEVAGDVNPSYAVAPGTNWWQRILAQGGVNAATDVGVQLSEIDDEILKDFSWERVGVNFLAGMTFQGGAEALGKLLGKSAAEALDDVASGRVTPEQLDAAYAEFDSELQAPIVEDFKAGATLEQLQEKYPEFLKDEDISRAMGEWVANRDAGGTEVPRFFETARIMEGDSPSILSAPAVKQLEEELLNVRRPEKGDAAYSTMTRSERLAASRAAYEAAGGGESGYFASLGALKGKIHSGPARESIREKFTQDDINILYDVIEKSDDLRGYEITNAHTGLAKLLGAENLSLPDKTELAALAKVFDPEVIRTLKKARPMREQALDAAGNLLSLPRTLMSTADLSAPLRQGGFLIRRGEFWQNLPEMAKAASSEKGFRELNAEIKNRPTYHLMEDAKLALVETEGTFASREEDFMSDWAKQIPVAGEVVKFSERGYTGYLNKLRADTFDTFVRQAAERGNDITKNPKALRAVAAYVNSATGRGDLPKFMARYAPALNATFFSPRLISSRLNLLLNPTLYTRLPAGTRREAMKDLVGYTSTALSVLGLAGAAGATVEWDPRSSDFAKIRVGDRRYDILGGFQQYLRLFATLATGEKKTLRGDINVLGEGYKADTRKDVIEDFGRSKASPNLSYIIDAFDGKNIIGEEFHPVYSALERLAPLFLQDAYEAAQEDGLVGVLEALPAFFGVGVGNYEAKTNRLGEEASPETENDPVMQEIRKVSEELGGENKLLGYVNKSDVTYKELTDQEFKDYEQTAGLYIKEDMAELMKLPEYQAMTPEEKQEIIKDLVKTARKEARDNLFPREETINPEDAEVVDSGKKIITSIFPNAYVTQERRDPNSALGLKNPDSWHTTSGGAVDVRPIPGMTFMEAVKKIESEGYVLLEAIDEVNNPSPWATGPHWHFVIGQ